MPTTFRFCPSCATPLERSQRGGAERDVCPADGCGFVHWDNPTPVVAALVEHEGDVILVRNQGWPETWYGLVTGFLERDESPEDGILRELREELSLDGEIQSMIGVYPFSMMNQVIIAFHVVASGAIVLGEELADFKRVKPHKLRPWPMGTGEAVRDWLADREFQVEEECDN